MRHCSLPRSLEVAAAAAATLLMDRGVRIIQINQSATPVPSDHEMRLSIRKFRHSLDFRCRPIMRVYNEAYA